MRLLLGIDCGLTLVKAALFDENGRKQAESRRKTPLQGHLLDPRQIWKCTASCVRDALQQAGASGADVLACGVSGHGNGLYALDARQRPVLAISSMVTLPQDVTHRFRESSAYADFRRRTRQTTWAGQPMQILRWLKDTDRPAYDRIHHVLLCKDWINFCLTGQVATEYSDASAAALLDSDGGELFTLLGIGEKQDALPPLRRSTDIVGAIAQEAAAETGLVAGTPVCGGFFDVAACMLGSGAVNLHDYAVVAGTWGISAAYLQSPVHHPALTQTCCFDGPDAYMAVVSAPTSCVNLDWFLHNIRPGLSYAEANAIAAAYAPAALDLLYLPFLHPDMHHPHVQAGFIGLKPRHTWQDMLRAVYEGVVFAHRLQVDRLRAAGIVRPGARLMGGAANAPLWCALMADCLGLPIDTLAEKQAGALGAAMAAAIAVELYPDAQTAIGRMVHPGMRYTPGAAGAYDEKYHNFMQWVGDAP